VLSRRVEGMGQSLTGPFAEGGLFKITWSLYNNVTYNTTVRSSFYQTT
jgi:hypothetical protein